MNANPPYRLRQIYAARRLLRKARATLYLMEKYGPVRGMSDYRRIGLERQYFEFVVRAHHHRMLAHQARKSNT